MVTASYNIDKDKRFQKALNIAIKNLDDLTIVYQLMAREWFKGNRSIFDIGRKGPGKYEDLSPKYKLLKQKKKGFIYPILVSSGRLASSMTNSQDKDSINTIVNKKILILGTKAKTEKGDPYAVFLHTGTKKMPARPYVLLGGEQVATKQINQRRENWIKLLKDFAIQKSRPLGDIK